MTARVSRPSTSCSIRQTSTPSGVSPGGSAWISGLRRREHRPLGDRRRPVHHRQRQHRRRPVDRERQRLGRRPRVRPVRAGQVQPDPVAGVEGPRGDLERDADTRRHAGLERRRILARVAVREVQHAARDERAGAVGEGVAELRRQVRDGRRRRHRHVEERVAEDVELVLERGPVVHERPDLVGSLVLRLTVREIAGAGDPPGPADVAARDLEGVGTVAGRCGGGLRELQRPLGQPLGRPRGLVAPFAPHLREVGLGLRRAAREHHDRRLPVDAVVDPLQPPVPPLELLGQDVDVRPRPRGVGRLVRPGPDDHALRAPQLLEGPQRVVRVPVGPAGDDHGGRLDRAVVLDQRSPLPVVVVALMLEPRHDPGLVRRHAPLPLVAPALAEVGRHRRQRVHRHHVRGVVDEVERLQRAAEVVHVVAVAVVGREDRDDRLQRRRPLHGGVDRVEARVRRAVHADGAAGPVLRREPADQRNEVGRAPRASTRRSTRPRWCRCRARRRGTRRIRARPGARSRAGTRP